METLRIKTGLPRPVEVFAAVIGILISLPLLVLSIIAVAATSRGPALFRQKRVGRKGQIFILYKLRTMRKGDGGAQITAAGDGRITWVGRILRKTKLDEIPELWNVIKGDMSLVGPRPEVPCYVDLKKAEWRLVLEARPGITDPVTLRLRNEEQFLAEVKNNREEFYLQTLQPFKLKGYLEYLSQRSWRTDIEVIWKTLLCVLFPDKAPLARVKEGLSLRSGNRLAIDSAGEE